ncbi:MAG: nucleotidyltransferase family protein, partial [Pseudomonadota bacterium]
VRNALPILGSDPFLIQNADCFWIDETGANIKRLINAWDGEQMDALLLLTSTDTALGYDGRGDFAKDEAGRLSRPQTGSVAPFVFAGASVASAQLFSNAPLGPFSLNVVWDRAREVGRLHGTELEGTWLHVGTPEAVEDAEHRLRAYDT